MCLSLAVQVANHMNHNYVGTEHILLGLLSDGGGVAVGYSTSYEYS